MTTMFASRCNVIRRMGHLPRLCSVADLYAWSHRARHCTRPIVSNGGLYALHLFAIGIAVARNSERQSSMRRTLFKRFF